MATAREEAELKQQGAAEAARNPESKVTADDAQRIIVEGSKKAGVTAINLDTNASRQERLAQAERVCLLV